MCWSLFTDNKHKLAARMSGYDRGEAGFFIIFFANRKYTLWLLTVNMQDYG